MNVMMVRAKLMEQDVADAQAATEKVIHALEQARPADIRYAASMVSDGVTFVAFLELEPGAGNPLRPFPAYAGFWRTSSSGTRSRQPWSTWPSSAHTSSSESLACRTAPVASAAAVRRARPWARRPSIAGRWSSGPVLRRLVRGPTGGASAGPRLIQSCSRRSPANRSNTLQNLASRSRSLASMTMPPFADVIARRSDLQ
jgi:hypothetical protein